MMKEERRKIVENYIDAYNEFDIPKMLRNLHQDLVFENFAGGEMTLKVIGKDKFAEQATKTAGIFKERKQFITSWEFDNNTVSIEVESKGVLATDLPTGEKLGEVKEINGTTTFQFVDNDIVLIRDEA